MKALINDHVLTRHRLLQTSGTTTGNPLFSGTVIATGGAAADYTLPAPIAGYHDGYEVTFIAGSAQAHILRATGALIYRGVTDSTPKTTATLTNIIGASITLVAYNGSWYLKASVNTVTYA